MAIDPNNLSATATLTFNDEFDGLSLWNGSSGTWHTNFNFNGNDVASFTGNGELQWYINANNPNTASVDPWAVSNGVLTLTAAPASDAIKPYINNYDYTSGMLSSQFSFSQTYGYFEMSAKLPAGQGLWPAFWLLPTNGSWRPEIDIMEVLGSDTRSLWQFSHPTDNAYDRFFNNQVPDMSAGFHRYGVDWQPDKVTFYFDGQVMGVAPTAPDMHGPMYIITNLAIGGSWAGPPDASTPFPAQMQIDYIRVYQANGAPSTTTLSISPSSQSLTEGTGGTKTFTYTVTRSGDLSSTSSVDWAIAGSGGSPVNGADFVGGALPSGSLSFAAGQTNAAIVVNIATDSAIEANESFTLTLSNAVGAGIGGASATGLVINDDSPAQATLSLSPSTITLAEGGSGQTYFVYTVTRTGDVSGPSVANWAVTGSGANGANAADFQGGVLPSGQVFFGGGEQTKQIFVPVQGDATSEADETFTLTLTPQSGAAIGAGTAQGVITNDDGGAPPPPAPPSLSISPTSVSQTEGASGSKAFTYTVTRSGDLSGTSSAQWTVAGSGANPASASDFAGATLPTGTVNFAAGQSSATVTVNVAGDAVVEPDEAFRVTLANPSGATLAAASANGVIVNDDGGAPPPPSLTIGPASLAQNEGNSGSTAFVFTVTRSGDLSGATSANWTVAGSGASPASGADFAGGVAPSGQVAFAAGQSSATITVNVAGDAAVEANESFSVALSNVQGGVIGTGSATGVITNDDAAASPTQIAISPGTITQAEGQGGTSYYVFTVARTGVTSGPSTVDYSVSGSGANPASPSDFQGGTAPSGRVWFGGGETSKTIWIPVAGDTTAEADESFTITLSGATGSALTTATATGVITNDDGAPPPSGPTLALATSLVTLGEGDAGSKAFAFQVTRSGDLSGASSAAWSVAGSGANPAAASDFQGGLLPTGVVNFAAGQSAATINVMVAGDTLVEANEDFTLTLSSATGATITGAAATGRITNDDAGPAPPPPPSIAISPASLSQAEGSSGQTAFVYTLTRNGDLSGSSTVQWTVTGSGASPASGNDFAGGNFPSGQVVFAAGQSSATISVAVAADTVVENNEAFAVTLSTPTGAVLGAASATGTITNDDVAPAGTSLAISGIDARHAEGDGGESYFVFEVLRSGDLSGPTVASWSVSGDGANAALATDFVNNAYPGGQVFFGGGESVKWIWVPVRGDTFSEADEGFAVTLSNATGASITTPRATGLILNDDGVFVS